MHYQFIFTKDGALPPGNDWALVRMADGIAYCLLRESCISPALLTEAWAALTRLTRTPIPA